MTDVQERVYTANDLLHMPDKEKRYELIHGELITMSPTGEPHGALSLALGALIWNHVRTNRLGRVYGAETGFVISTNPDTILAPDAAFISTERARPMSQNFAPVAPDLAVEIVSPSNTAKEMNEKVSLYFQAGTQQVWIVYPETQTLHLYDSATSVTILTRKDTLDGGRLLPNFKLPLEELFTVLDN